MAATRVQTKTGNSGSYVDTYNFTFDSSTTTGNTLIVALSYNNDQAGTASVTDNKGNTFYKIAGGDSGGYSNGELWYAYNITGGASHQITVTFSANYHDCAHVAREYGGLTTTDPLDKSASGATAASTSHTSATTATTTQANELVIGALGLGHNSTFTAGSGYGNLSSANASDIYESVAIEDKDVISTGTQQATMTTGTSAAGYFIVATFKEAASATIEQEGFAFGSDDNNEASHTLNTQDSNLTAPVGTKTLRLLLNATGDPASSAYKLKYQENGSGGYVDVPVGSTSNGQTGAIEAPDITESGNNTATTSWAVSHPAASTGDLLIFNIAWDDSTTTTGLTAPSGPNGETAVLISDVTASANTACRGKVVYYIATGSWSAGTITFTPSASEQWTAAVIKVPAGEFNASSPIGATNTNPSTGTTDPLATPSLSAGANDGGGRVVAFFSVDTEDPDGSMTGWTMRADRDRGAIGLGIYTRDALATASESIAEATGLTKPTNVDWVSFAYIVKPPIVTNQVYISTSANVAAGGESTTARLTAPSGKTTSDFDTGRRWDDENGSDSIDITADDYTELEWVLTTQSPAVDTDYFDFRVYAGDSALSTYALTPRWTIGTVSATNTLINIGDAFKDMEELKINVGDAWKTAIALQINVGDSWATVFGSVGPPP